MKEAKFPISDDEMRVLLQKYPFLVIENFYDREPVYKNEEEKISKNWYKEFDGYGWEELWKRYLKHLFGWYDQQSEEVKKSFHFSDVKEKFGELRIYTVGGHGEDLEWIAEWLSSVTCQFCGKVTKDEEDPRWFKIWRTGGWISNMCEECAKKYQREMVERDQLDSLMVKVRTFGYRQYIENGVKFVRYEDDGNGWLKKIEG